VAKSFEHLSDAQLEHYGTKSFTVTPEEEQKIEAHLEDCANCRSRVLENQRVRFGLLASSSIKAGARVAPGFIERGSVHPVAVEPGSVQGLSSDGVTPGQPVPADWDPYKPASTACIVPDGPSEDDLRNLAAGTIAPDKAMAITHHAVECPHCALILRLFAQDFSDDLTAEELGAGEDFLSQLKSSTPGWQKEIAAQAMQANRGANPSSTSGASASSTSDVNPSTSGAKIFGWPMRRVLAPAAIAAGAVIAFGLWFTQRDTPEKVEKLLAQAYTENRTMEYRWPGAEWGPVRVTRGSSDSASSRPLSLLDSEEVISRHAGVGSIWNRVRGQAEILEHDPDSAIHHIQNTANGVHQSADLLTKLAIAYSLKAEREKASENRALALNLLDEALKIDPANRAALYNRAFLKENMGLARESEVDWTRLLSEEKDPGWIDETRKRVEELHSSGSK
jgi:tetratricopeptide (TPR) repeat protein